MIKSNQRMVRVVSALLPLLLHVVLVQGKHSFENEDCGPMQIHLTVGKDASSSMTVSFASSSSLGCGISSVAVLLGTDRNQLDQTFTETEEARQYNYSSPLPSVEDVYVSDYYHHINVQGLEPETEYFYRCVVVRKSNSKERRALEENSLSLENIRDGFLLSSILQTEEPSFFSKWGANGNEQGKTIHSMQVKVHSSDVSIFRTAPQPGNGLGDLRFAFVGDVGRSDAANATIHHMSAVHQILPISSILLVGDISYANTVQRKWDSWFCMVEHLLKRVPMQTAPGNHEIEVDDVSKEVFVPYDARFTMPWIKPVHKAPSPDAEAHKGRNLKYDFGNAFYAYTYGAARFVVLSSFSQTGRGSVQRRWLARELASVDRTVTPWLFVGCHVPLYNTFSLHGHSPVGEQMKASMEYLFVKYKVNVVFSGHVHAYMRTKNVIDGSVNSTGPQYIIIGDGGYGDGTEIHHDPEEWVEKQDERTHGFGTIKLVNKTHAYWRWIRNVDEHFSTVQDRAYILNQYFEQ